MLKKAVPVGENLEQFVRSLAVRARHIFTLPRYQIGTRRHRIGRRMLEPTVRQNDFPQRGAVMEGKPKEDPPSDLPPVEHEEAVKLEEARRTEKLKQTHGGSHRTAGSAADLPKVHSDDD